jgi:hypothetical protein
VKAASSHVTLALYPFVSGEGHCGGVFQNQVCYIFDSLKRLFGERGVPVFMVF